MEKDKEYKKFEYFLNIFSYVFRRIGYPFYCDYSSSSSEKLETFKKDNLENRIKDSGLTF